MIYYVTFKANVSPRISQETGGWVHYAMLCNGKAQMEKVKGELSKMTNVRYVRVGTNPNKPSMKKRKVINATTWLNNNKTK